MEKTEAQEQAVIFQWASYNYGKYPELEKLMFSIPNGSLRNKMVAVKLRREGVKAGTSDFTIQVPRCGYHGLWIELKAEKGRKQDNQVEFIDAIRKQGYYADFVFGADDAIQLIQKYMDGKIRRQL